MNSLDIITFSKQEAMIIRELLAREEKIARNYQYNKADRKYYQIIERALEKVDLFLDPGSPEKDQHLIEQDIDIINLKADKELVERINHYLNRIRDTVPTHGSRSFEDPLFNLMIAVESITQLIEVRTNRKLKKYGYPMITSKRGLK